MSYAIPVLLLIFAGAVLGWLVTLANAERALSFKHWCKSTWANWRKK